MQPILRLLRAGVLGILIFFFVHTASNVMQTTGSENLTSWLGGRIHERFVKYGDRRGVEAYTRRTYLPEDLAKSAGLARSLAQPGDPLTRYLSGRLPEETRNLLSQTSSGAELPAATQEALAEALNLVLNGESLYAKERFEGRPLSTDLRWVLALRGLLPKEEWGSGIKAEELQENDFSNGLRPSDLNRMLLEEAFPGELPTLPRGSEIWPQTAPHIKLWYYITPGVSLGFLLGMGGGAIALWLENRRKRNAPALPETRSPLPATNPSPLLSWRLPALLAAAGILFHGYFLGLAAFLLVAHTPLRGWRACLLRTCCAGVVLFWGLGSELWWGSGWSKVYPFLNRFLKGLIAT